MHIYFSGIGGAGLGPLALIAHQAGYQVSGSDLKDSAYIDYLRSHGIDTIHIGQTVEQIRAVHQALPIDWLVYSSAVAIEDPDAPELRFCRAEHIKTSKRDVLLSTILADKGLELVAIAGTHGKTTTTAMAIWLFKQLGIPTSYSVGAKMSFGDMGLFDPASKYFIYEADEYDRNFLAFQPKLSIITGIDYDHHDIYPTREDYQQAFSQFISQSELALLWNDDFEKLGMQPSPRRYTIDHDDARIRQSLHLPGTVNREDAWEVAAAVELLTQIPVNQLLGHLDAFPGVSRRFEKLLPGLYTDYAHTPPKIRGTLDTAREVAKEKKVIAVYEGLHNTRQHFIKAELPELFESVDHLYIVPTYLAREDKTLALMTPENLRDLMSAKTRANTTASKLDDALEKAIRSHLEAGDIVVCMTAGSAGSLDEWLRSKFTAASTQQPSASAKP